ncbi:MAG: CotH kinase family protein [Fibrobacteria bacterium]|nr:CotH kinase family protein [Fibrobacteria bacterium]
MHYMNRRENLGRLVAMASSLAFLVGCGSSTNVEDPPPQGIERGGEWEESSHGNVDPDTLHAFPSAARRRMVLSMPDSTWMHMEQALTEACGTGAAILPTCTGSGLDGFPDVSEWHQATLLADGREWKHVGFRMRSNSDLADAWKKGNRRYPFRITMDKWEGEFPTIDNQRFYGFKKLRLESVEGDTTLLRHQLAGAILRERGVAVLAGTLVDLRIARGADTLDLGVYTLREEPGSPLLDRHFGSSSGNWYEPSSILGDYVRDEFKAGDNDGTHTDVLQFLAALNSSSRTTDPASWRSGLRATFDLDGFLEWLSVTSVLGEHGSYGDDAENWGLYAKGGPLHWVALDMDKTFPLSGGLYKSVWHPGATTDWPLIGKVLADSVLCRDFTARSAALVAPGGPLSTAVLSARIAQQGHLLDGLAAAETSKALLLAFAKSRPAIVDSSLAAHACPVSL